LTEALAESELFGHIKGAFTGADRDHDGYAIKAEGGTLFLDEIGDYPLPKQASLFRFLDPGQFSRVGEGKPRARKTRIVAATNKNVDAASEFRPELAERFALRILVPPLRDRLGDIPLLAFHFLRGTGKRISDEAIRTLEECSWPGNVRQLKRVIGAAEISSRGDVITSDDVAPYLVILRLTVARWKYRGAWLNTSTG